MEKSKERKFRRITRFGNTLKTNKSCCFYCNTKLDEYSRTVDHLIPKSKGGIRSNDNKVFACRKCNQLKADLDPHQFYTMIDRMLSFEITSSKERVGFLKKVLINTHRLITKNNVSNRAGISKKNHKPKNNHSNEQLQEHRKENQDQL